MNVIGIDAGTTQTAICVFNGDKFLHCSMFDNSNEMFELITLVDRYNPKAVYIEDMVSYGMPVGRDVFMTVKFIAKMELTLWRESINHVLVERPHIKRHHCMNSNAKDANVTAALVDRFDPERRFGKFGKGTNANKGPFFGFSGSDMWSSAAIAVYGHDLERMKNGIA